MKFAFIYSNNCQIVERTGEAISEYFDSRDGREAWILAKSQDLGELGEYAKEPAWCYHDALLVSPTTRKYSIVNPETRQPMNETVGLIVGAIFLMFLLVAFNRRRKPALKAAYDVLERISRSSGNELERISETLELAREVVGDHSSFQQRELQGESRELGELILRQIDGLEAMSSEMQRVLTECDELMHPTSPVAQAANMLTTSRYLHCVNVAQGKSFQSLAFPQDETTSSWLGFDEFLGLMQRRRAITESNLKRFHDDLALASQSVGALQEQLESIHLIQEKLNQLRQGSTETHVRRNFSDRNWLNVPLFHEKLLPRLEDRAEELAKEVQRDPVGVQETSLPQFTKKLEDISGVISAIENASVKDIKKIETSRKSLQELNLSTRWMDRRQRDLEDELQRFVSKAVQGESVTELANGISDGLNQFSIRVAQCVELANKIKDELSPELESLKQELEQARNEIAERIGVSNIMALRESGYSPDDELQRAHQQLLAVKAALGRGDIDSANSAIGEIEIESKEASRFIENSLLAIEEFPGKVQLNKGILEKIKQRLPRLDESLKLADERFDRSALEIGVHPDDPVVFDVRWIPVPNLNHSPSSDETVQTKSMYDLYRIAESWLRDATEGIKNAERSYERGQILVACNDIDLLETDLNDLEGFMDRFEARLSFMDQLQQENDAALKKARKRFEDLQSEISSKKSEQSKFVQSTKACDELRGKVKDWRFETSEPNPILRRQYVREFEESLDEISALTTSEDKAYHETMDAFRGVEQEMRIARQLVKNSIQDGIPDSQQITQDQANVRKLEQHFNELQQKMSRENSNWMELDREATLLQIQLSQVNGRLRNEVKGARQAGEAIQAAAEAVFQAANWRGEYGIVVVGRPGAQELNQARQLLANGIYLQAALQAREAERIARNGLVAAQAQVARHRRNARQNIARRDRMKREFWS